MTQNQTSHLTLLLGPAGCGKTHILIEAFIAALKRSAHPLKDDLLFILPTAEHRERTIDLILRHDLPGFFHKRITTFDRAVKEFLKLGGIDFATDVTRRIILKEILRRPNKTSNWSLSPSPLPLLGGEDKGEGAALLGGLTHVELGYFQDAADTSGFLDLMGRTIAELKENLIRQDELERRFQSLKKRFPEFSSKYDDLTRIYKAYEDELNRRNLIDQRDALKLLEEGLKRGEFASPKLRGVWIDGFSDFSKLQLAFIDFLTRHADRVTVTLTMDNDPLRRPLFQIASETQIALEDMGFTRKWMEEKNYRTERQLLRHLQERLFQEAPLSGCNVGVPFSATQRGGSATSSGGMAPVSSGAINRAPTSCGMLPHNEMVANPSIQVFEATGLLGEIEMIAREIKRLVRAHQYHFSDIALLFRMTDPYLPVIRSVFRKFQIPVEIHERFRLRTSPIARTLSSFFAILLNGWCRKDIFNFLKCTGKWDSPQKRGQVQLHETNLSPFLGTVPFSCELIAQLELKALEKGVFKDRRYWLSTFPKVKFFEEIAHFEDQFLKIETADGLALWVEDVMKHFGLLEFPDSLDDPTTCVRPERPAFFESSAFGGESRRWDEGTRRDREAARRILLLLEEMKWKRRGVIYGARGPAKEEGAMNRAPTLKVPPPPDDGAIALAKEFLALMEVDLYSVHSRDKNKVQVYNVSLARQKEYKVVFLAGLLEKQFPIQVKEDPILSDAERRTLNRRGEVLKERLPRQAFERYLFYLAVTRAREHLILSYPRFDLEGKEALPSFYVDEVRRLFDDELPGRKQHVTDVLPSLTDVATVEEAEQRVVKDIWSVPEGKRNRSETRFAFALYNHVIRNPGFQQFVDRLFQPMEGVMTDVRIRPHFIPRKGVWNPTMLEEYAECPYRFFAHRLLVLESQTEGIDIRRRGTILHDVLQSFFTWRRDHKEKIGFEKAKDFCMKKFDQLWEEEPLAGDRYYKIELERRRMQEMILEVLRVELVEAKPPIAGLTPMYFEYEFQDVILKGEQREIPLRGKIDRIDVDPEGKFGLVIDYKTGQSFKLSALENGTSLQLPLYIIAAREKLGLEPLGGHLYVLAKAFSSGFHHQDHLARAGLTTRKCNHLTEKEFDSLVDRSIRFAEKFVDRIERAEIPVKPRDCVSYCPYSSLCRIEKWRLKHIYRDLAEEDKGVLMHFA